MSHTPGKWHWDSDLIKSDPLSRRRYRVSTIGKTITQVYHNSDDPHAEADTRLIAAAPELLEALKLAEDEMTRNDFGTLSLLPKIRAAIAKAEGKS